MPENSVPQMRTHKSLLIGLPLMAGIIGTAYLLGTSLMQTALIGRVSEPVQKRLAGSDVADQDSKRIKPVSGVISTASTQVVTKAGSVQRRRGGVQKTPGLFRGDWGETPVYSKNDRVNYQRAAYLSLENANHNQPPATSPGYWRLIKKFKEFHQEACFTPGPGRDLAECDFTEAASLTGMDLHGAVLRNARLNGDLGAADLSGANLSGAAVIGSLIIGPDTRIDHANLAGLQSDGNNPLIAESANLSGVNFAKANLYGARMQYADLSGATLTGAALTGSQLASADFDNADLSKTDLTYANLAMTSLKAAALSEANLEQADLRRADLSSANLRKANLAATNIAGVNFSGADLRGVNLSFAQGADSAVIDSQTDFAFAICPDGVTVDGAQVKTCIGHGF